MEGISQDLEIRTEGGYTVEEGGLSEGEGTG